MYTYALKCLETDYTTLLSLATALGVIRVVNNEVIPEMGCAWDYIGYKRVGDIVDSEMPDTRPFLKNAQNVKYVHINAITSFNVREKAEAMAIENPAIAQGLSAIPKYFIVDAEGNATLPSVPLRVFL